MHVYLKKKLQLSAYDIFRIFTYESPKYADVILHMYRR